MEPAKGARGKQRRLNKTRAMQKARKLARRRLRDEVHRSRKWKSAADILNGRSGYDCEGLTSAHFTSETAPYGDWRHPPRGL